MFFPPKSPTTKLCPLGRELGNLIYIWMFPKIVGVFTPNHPLENRVFHYFHHPFWGNPPYFWFNTHITNLQSTYMKTFQPTSNPSSTSPIWIIQKTSQPFFVCSGRLVEPQGLKHSGCSDLTLGVGSFLSKVPVAGGWLGGSWGRWLAG